MEKTPKDCLVIAMTLLAWEGVIPKNEIKRVVNYAADKGSYNAVYELLDQKYTQLANEGTPSKG